jgi:hypothetical protein
MLSIVKLSDIIMLRFAMLSTNVLAAFISGCDYANFCYSECP